MTSQANTNKNQKKQSIINRNDSGSDYHKEHAGNVEGYGEPHPITNDRTKENNQ
ncbi:hypothetical protein [Bacillus sp. PS06]|uniref:hypothetical protein n=1 Tax=Bacillus sp. PS06 TaxID=2764176 RepID=UPI00177B3AA4|nr:hypothetical protein [Bacillus sp. PS06]MBD8068081.1 hypothetical protein [Bacillus sp. PS06]